MASTTATSPVPGATPTPSSAQASIQPPSLQSLPSTTDTAVSDGFVRPGSPRKRRRSPDRVDSPAKNLDSQVRDKLGITSPPLTIELTGAAEMAEQKKRKLDHATEGAGHPTNSNSKEQSTNPYQQALSTLRGSSRAVSKPSDAPQIATSAAVDTRDAHLGAANHSDEVNISTSAHTSPASNTSFSTATSANANGNMTAAVPAHPPPPPPPLPPPQVASPTQMGESDGPGDDDVAMVTSTGVLQTASPKSYSYPDPSLNPAPAPSHSRRDMSLPGAGPSDETRSPGSNKKHKCPYCDTEFTRHHNLKSHLLTHSQEKPYRCDQCEMRFRRLHDLKRHTKLHTGERPHVCPICNRKFARGDALARHTKGAGGCAGHRSSVGSFTNEAMNEGEMVIDSLMYTGEASQEPGEMEEGEGPSRQLRHAQYQSSLPQAQSRASSTYPPVAARGTSNYLQAPGTHPGGVVGGAGNGGAGTPPSTATAPKTTSSAAAAAAAAAAAVTTGGGRGFRTNSPAASHTGFNQGNHQSSYPSASSYGPAAMTESPAPISPSTNHHSGPHDHRRSSANQQLHNYARQGVQGQASPQPGGAGPAPTATMGLPPPQSTSSNTSTGAAGGHLTQLPPPLPSITTDGRGGTGSAVAHGHNASGSTYQSGPGSASTHNSISSHGQSSGDRGNLGIDERERLWAIISSLKSELHDVREKQEVMDRELKALRTSQMSEQANVQ